MKWLVVALIGVSSLFSATGAKAATEQLVSRSVGRVLDHIVTSREIQINQAVENALFGKKPDKLDWPKVDSSQFSRAVSNTLLEWAVALEAKNFDGAESESQKAQADALRQVGSKLGGQRQWKEAQVDATELSQLIDRKLRAKQLIRFKVQASAVPVTDAEAKAYFDENRLKFGNMPFANFKDSIKSFLRRQQVDRRLKEWFDLLQRKYQVRNFTEQT